MIKTQIQLPDELYHALKRVAAAKEWSLAETLRRGAEQFLQQFPDPSRGTPSVSDWEPPRSATCGWKGLSPEELQETIWQVAEPRLSHEHGEA